MTISSEVQGAAAADELYYDPYSVELNMNPYAVFARLREEAPLYYNSKQDFYALSRFDDVNKALIDHETFISGRGALLEIIKSGMEALTQRGRHRPPDNTSAAVAGRLPSSL